MDRALVIHTRSRVLKGTRTKLTLAARFLALSGYMKWCVVRLPASSSKPTVGARLILGAERGLVGPGPGQEPSGKHSGLGCLRRPRPRRGRGQGPGTSSHRADSGLLQGLLAQRGGPEPPRRFCSSLNLQDGSGTPPSRFWSTLLPHDVVVPVDGGSVSGPPQVPRVAHHSAAQTPTRVPGAVRGPSRDHLKRPQRQTHPPLPA